MGAFGADVTLARTALPGQGTLTGQSYRLSYSKFIPSTQTNIAIAAYRYSTGGYFDLNTAMAARDPDQSMPGSVLRQRNRASLTLSEDLGQRWGHVSLNASTTSYWNRPEADTGYSFSYGNTFRNINFNLSASRELNSAGQPDTLYYASVSIPLGKTHPVYASTSVSHDSGGSTQLQTLLTGTAGAGNNMSWSVAANHAAGGSAGASTGGSATGTWSGPHAVLTGSVGAATGSSQASVGISGGVVAHPGGVTFSQPLGDTIGIVGTPHAEGAKVLNALGVSIDSRGYAVVPYLTPYQLDTIELDPKGLSTDVELKETSLQIAPYSGAVVLLRYATDYGRSALIRAKRSDGTPLPFGASVQDASGREIGVVGQTSRIFARGLRDNGDLTVRWGDDIRSLCNSVYRHYYRRSGQG